MIDRDIAVRRCYEVPGQMYPRELCWLYDNLAGSKRHAEVGVFCGRSLYASCGGMTDATVYAVDLESPICLAPTPGAEWLVAVRNATLSAVAVANPTVKLELLTSGSLQSATQFHAAGIMLDSVFIDGSHEYEDVATDIKVWAELVKPGGLISGHDFWPPDQGVMRAVHECFGERFTVVPNCRIWYTHK